VLVSHSDSTIIELCDRAVWIDHGVTMMAGEAKDVVRAYNLSSPSNAPSAAS
jgi:ABC-type polysaccharide/polyol phosphate transport system ATPase subunit